MDLNIIGLISAFLYVVLVILIATILQSKKIISNEGSRKFIHIAVSNCWVIIMLFFDNVWLAVTPPIAFIIINYISYRFDLIKSMERSGQKDLGTVYFSISLTILVLLSFWLDAKYIGAIGVFILGYGDGLAAIVGKKYGFKKLFHNKTYVGSLTMFIISLVVSMILFGIFLPSLILSGSLIIALFATVIELYTPHDLDNVTVPVGSSIIAYILVIIGTSATNLLAIALILNLLAALAAYKKKALDKKGTFMAIIMGIVVFILAGPITWLAMMTFFASSSAISYLKKEAKAKLSSEYEKIRRDYKQVLANGLMATIMSVVFFFTKSDAVLFSAITSIAICCADTWGSELGPLSKGSTFSIISFKRVSKGTSGGVSLLGTAMSLFGSILIAMISLLIFIFRPGYAAGEILLIFVIISALGLVGSLIDSFLGATIQAKYKNKNQQITESPTTAGKNNKQISGLKFINNGMVNFLSVAIGTLISLIIFIFII